ncbi:unnamed protein product [Rotaria sp. Silwood2]|nr:unnamed protein product [Rotaria sp. Silwood2]
MGRGIVAHEKKIEIKSLLENGFGQQYIARQLNVSQKCVFGVAQKLKQNLPLFNSVGQGRKKATTKAEDQYLLKIMKQDRTKSSQMLAAEWNSSNGKQLCASTVRRRLINMGYKSYTTKRKPLRTPDQIKQRLKFANDHKHWLKEWQNIIWSDEAHFEVLNRKNRTFVRRLKSESNEPFNFVPRVQGGGGSVSVWGCMSGGARGPLVTYTGRLNGPAYVKVIEEALPMFIENTFDAPNNNWAYMHDNALAHRSKYTADWFENNHINVLEWPSNSPDMNPIENVWDYMDKQLRKLKPTNVGQLQEMIGKLWCGFTPIRCQQLVNSMPRRVQQCILARGKTFSKY